MHPIRHRGVGKGEVLVFLVILGVVAAVLMYVNQKPTVVQRTIVIEEAPAPPPPQVAAPVATAEPAAVRVTPEPMAQLPETVVIITPPAPECIAIEKKLRIAQQAAVQVDKDIAAARQAALDGLRQSADYQSMKTELEEKKKAKDDALKSLRQDEAAGNDTDHDTADVRAASLAWAMQTGMLTRLENETVVGDETANRKSRDLKDIKAEIVQLQKQLEDYIKREINSVCDHSECQIDDVKLDADKWIIDVEMTPVNQVNPGAMADAALNNVGTVLETLSKSPFTWQEIRFRVCGETPDIVQYQLTYTHNETADRNFELLHMNSLLYPPIHTADLHIGAKGILLDVNIVNVIDENNMIVCLDESNGDVDDILKAVWIRGINTVGRVDDSNLDIMTPLIVTGTIQYKSAGGGLKTIYMLEPTGFHQNLLICDYFDNGKLLTLAQDIWLNSAIDRIQGRQALPDSYVRQPGMKPPELMNTLLIGGYTRSDGSVCPVTFLHSPHPVRAAATDPPENRTPRLPGPHANSNPLIVNNPPPAPGF